MAFKSSSRRGSQNPSTDPSPPLRRRSQSVSAASRAKPKQTVDNYTSKTDNPLFLNSDSAKEAGERGRSSTRNSGVKNGIGRSLSRARGRSVSYEESGNDIKRKATSSNTRQGADVLIGRRSPQIIGGSEDDSVCSFQFSNLEDATSSCSLSEAEDKISKSVYKKMMANQSGGDAIESRMYDTVQSPVRRTLFDFQNDFDSAVQWSKVSGEQITDVNHISAHLVDSRPVELVSDIRREYALKLEESEERARKLRADLAVEEHRGLEFSRMLKETLPTQISNSHKSRMGRKRSTERKTISNCLTEEALAYFDECVSISTFDNSDFSASEDRPTPAFAGNSSPFRCTTQQTLTSSPLLCASECSSNQTKSLNGRDQPVRCCDDSNLAADCSCDALSLEHDPGTKFTKNKKLHQFSFAQKPKENIKSNISIRSCIDHFQRGISVNTRLEFSASKCSLRSYIECVLCERVYFSNRLDSGSLHLCGGSVAVSVSPFGSMV